MILYPIFLLVLVVEGLEGLVRKAMNVGEYYAFQVKEGCGIDILQLVDNTLLIGNGGWKQI